MINMIRFISLIVFLAGSTIYSQVLVDPILYNPVIIPCQSVTTNSTIANSLFVGYSKPERTDYQQTSIDAYFPVMIIFVQFANDPGPEVPYWPRGGVPDYMNTILAPNKKYPVGNNWWDTYSESTEYISDFWMEQSRGHLHMAGPSYSITLDHDYEYYVDNGGFMRVNDDIYQKLNALYFIDWRMFDKWKMIATPDGHSFDDVPDGFVDMIYKVFRSHAPIPGMPAGGTAMLGESYFQGLYYLIDPANEIYINGGFGSQGSGITLTPGYGGTIGTPSYSPYNALTRRGMVSFSGHEHGHYLYGGGHGNYGKMSAAYGLDECLSPWESVALGYIKTKKVNYDISSYVVGDFSSRHSDLIGEVLEVPVTDTTEFFLIANRRKGSYYDRIMWGDTAHDDPYRNINPEYGKGIYIYHTNGGYLYPATVDQECADGLHNWVLSGYEHPDWSNEQLIPYFTKSSVSYYNDKSLGRISDADGKSIFAWFGIGAKHQCMFCDGTDRVYSNKSEVWTSREGLGDRWDAWNIGYNEIFSPYSSPSTISWDNLNTGVFVWYNEFDVLNNEAKFRIFRAGYGGYAEKDILSLTPPSRPMGLRVDLTECVDDLKYPVLTWQHNMEPDMISPHTPTYDGKWYRIYYAKTSDNSIPDAYNYLATINMDSSLTPRYVDYRLPIICIGLPDFVNIRYRVTAVDNTGWESVKSDFAHITIGSQDQALKLSLNKLTPEKYALHQNYPNPFNPATFIKFDIASAGHVKLSVYNLLGEEIILLVDGHRPAGSYSVVFDGLNLPSGIYVYRLNSANFTESKKMVLIK